MITRRFSALLVAATGAAVIGAASWGTAASASFTKPVHEEVCAEIRADLQNLRTQRDASTDPDEINRLNRAINLQERAFQFFSC